MQEAAFFVREYDADRGAVRLSDGSEESFEPTSLHWSKIDEGYLCFVKRDLEPEGLLARFTHSAHAQLLDAVEEGEDGEPWLRCGSATVSLAFLESG